MVDRQQDSGQDLAHLTAMALQAARKAGADAADALAVAGDTLSIEVLKGALEHAERAEGIDLGLRVLVGRRQASVAVSDTRPQTIAALAERAVAMAREAPEDPYAGLAEPNQLARHWDLAALDLTDPAPAPAPADLQQAALRAEAAAAAVAGVSQVQGTGAGWQHSRVHLAASNGFSGGYARSGTSLSCVAISGEGLAMQRDWAAEQRSHAADLPLPEEIGTRAGERAVAMQGAGKPPGGAWPVLFDERVSAGLIGHLLAAINGASVARGSSWLRDAMGAQVLPAGLSLTEDPTLPRLSGSRPFDGEGLRVARRDLVRNGVLQSWVLDLASARQLGLSSTGNASRGTGGPPSPSVGNIELTPGSASRDDLLAQMGTGLLVTSLIGSSINPTTGDYSRGASGFWVQNGQIVRPVHECTIAGNLRQMLTRITPANDARPWASRRVPSLLVEGLTIAGE